MPVNDLMPNATIIRTESIVFLETTKEIWKSDEKMARCGILIKNSEVGMWDCRISFVLISIDADHVTENTL